MEQMVETATSTLAGYESAAETPPQRPVDLVHLSRYTLGNRVLEREILELYRTQSRLYLRKLADAVCEKSWGEAAHTIKGSARGIGAWGVSAAAEMAEGLSGTTPAEQKAAVVAALAAEIDEANEFISAVLADA